jgi:hypothetical protein
MSNINNQDENDLDFEKKSLKEKYLEQKFLSVHVHEYVRLISLVIVCQHLGSMSSNKYTQLQELTNANVPLQIAMIFIFCFINSKFNLELSIMSTIFIVVMYISFRYFMKKK